MPTDDEEDTPPPRRKLRGLDDDGDELPPPQPSPHLDFPDRHDVKKKRTVEISLPEIQAEVKRTAKRRAPTTVALALAGVLTPASFGLCVTGLFKLLSAHDRIAALERQHDEDEKRGAEERDKFERLRERVVDTQLGLASCRCSK